MMPKLYESNELLFESNGIGVLSDAISCTVTEELNGAFELQLEYPINGIFAEQFALRRIIFAKPSPLERAQPFRIYEIRKGLSMLFISAEHISYDLNGYAVQMEQSGDIFEYVNYIKTKCVNERFDFNLSVEGPDGGYTFFEHIKPATARALLFNLTNLPNNPDLKFDRFDVKILTDGRGKDKGFSIRYGVNLLEYSQSDLFQNVYTHIMPYWLEDIGTGQEFIVTHYLPEKIISTGANYNFSRILPVDFTTALSKYNEVTDGVFRFEIDTFLSENNLGIPDPEIVVDVASFENLTNGNVSDVELGDVVKVVLPQYALEIPRRCVKTIFDCLRDRYVQLEIGRTRTGIEHDIYTLYKQQEENKFDIAYERIYNRNNYQRKY